MQAFELFKQNFASSESLLQLYELFHGLRRAELSKDLRLAVCRHWSEPDHAVIHPSSNNRVMVISRATTPIPETLVSEGGLDFLLRQAVVVACTSLEAFFWDALRENVLTIVQARRRGADDSIRKLTLTLEDYLSIQEYQDPDVRLRQIILKNFERGTLYDTGSMDKIAKILTVKDFWKKVADNCGESEGALKTRISELIQRRNQIAHRADRPDEGETADGLGLRPITLAWANSRIQSARTLVTAAQEVFTDSLRQLEDAIAAEREQEEARKYAERSDGNREDA